MNWDRVDYINELLELFDLKEHLPSALDIELDTIARKYQTDRESEIAEAWIRGFFPATRDVYPSTKLFTELCPTKPTPKGDDLVLSTCFPDLPSIGISDLILCVPREAFRRATEPANFTTLKAPVVLPVFVRFHPSSVTAERFKAATTEPDKNAELVLWHNDLQCITDFMHACISKCVCTRFQVVAEATYGTPFIPHHVQEVMYKTNPETRLLIYGENPAIYDTQVIVCMVSHFHGSISDLYLKAPLPALPVSAFNSNEHSDSEDN